ncbi:hypothetical protein AX17_001496 [Amanita inopinata Kibby_2008]|nr:hypothetical protein AX17_001496 [Amanita inopinata Kibby_2008]
MSSALKFITVPAKAKHTATVIFTHGLGDTGHGWEPVAGLLQMDPGLQHVKWVLPHAPVRPVTLNMGIAMPSWFDIYSLDGGSKEDEKGMLESMQKINQLITTEVDAGISASRIILGGFSQGGALSLLTGLTSERKVAGIAVLSGWLPLPDKIKAMSSEHASSLPIFWGHGSSDPVVKYNMGKRSTEHLTKVVGIPVASPNDTRGLEFHTYEGMAHSASEAELDDLKRWLKSVIP